MHFVKLMYLYCHSGRYVFDGKPPEMKSGEVSLHRPHTQVSLVPSTSVVIVN